MVGPAQFGPAFFSVIYARSLLLYVFYAWGSFVPCVSRAIVMSNYCKGFAIFFWIASFFILSSASYAVTYSYTQNATQVGSTACYSQNFSSISELNSCVQANHTSTLTNFSANGPYQYSGGTSGTLTCTYMSGTSQVTANSCVGFSRNGDSCPAGYTFDAASGRCNAPCTVSGQVNDGTGACTCPPGQQVDTGTFVDILAGYTSSCKTPADRCSRRAGKSESSLTAIVSIDGCSVSCTAKNSLGLSTGAGDFPYICTYTGAAVGGDPDATKPNTATSAPGTPPAAAPPTTQPPNPDGSCPTSGSSSGFVNGTFVCVPPTQPNGQPNTPPSATNPTTTVTNTTTTTVTNTDGSTTTIITSTSGTTGGTQGANQCDPTAANYATCINLAAAVTAGVNASTGGTNAGGGGNGNGGGPCNPNSSDYLTCLAGDQTATEHTAGTANSFGDALNNFQDQLRTTPMGHLASSSGIGGSVNVGSCPQPTFEAFNRTYTINAHCQIFADVSPLLTPVMHVIYIVFGILILLSA